MAEPVLLVISDLHLGSGVLDDFEPEIEKHLVDFLGRWRAEASGTELVINGDFLDFVQAPPYKDDDLRDRAKDGTRLCFTEYQSRCKLEAIHRDHEATFSALREFLAYRQENRVILLPGNHDADFYWPGVQKDFTSLVCGSHKNEAESRLVYWLDPAYQPERFPGVWIEHGHQHDQVNRFFIKDVPCWSAAHRPIFKDRKGTERLYECIGTRFLIQYLNDIDKEYPYVDNVKPFWRFLQLFGASGRDAPLKALVAVGEMTRYLAKTFVTRPKDLLAIEEGTKPVSAAAAVLDAFQKSTPSRQQAFMQAIQERKFQLQANPSILLQKDDSAAPLLGFLAENLDLLNMIDPGHGRTMELGQAFFADETDDLRQEAFRIVNHPGNRAQSVIMGHTHEVVSEPKYINTGSWTRYYKLTKGAHLHPWEVLKKTGWKEFPYELNYAMAQPGSIPAARLENHYRLKATADA